ncbi:MAG: 50S ribosomal protein L2 [Parcubacteria group bacterium GW2011_GWA1_36_12]|nr:MAG: 50S ribosomal protein L2 [Parcubacteria group bacterium GW2011_GWA1_36_12]
MKATKILTKKRPERKLITSLKKRGGRNSSGRITIRHRGGGAKRYYRVIDFGQGKINIPAKVIALEYDPNRTSFIALLEYQDKDRKYVIAPNGLKIGEEVIIAEKADLKTGNRMRLKNVSSGTEIFNIELEPDRGGKMIRGAGTSAQVLAQEGVYTHLKMPSGEVRKVRGECYATIGSVSYPEWRYVKLGKAGSSRHRGRRPAVRGVAMAPIAHPHGGGEGRSSIGMKHPKTPWGKPAFGVRTRNKKKWTGKLILQRRNKKRK